MFILCLISEVFEKVEKTPVYWRQKTVSTQLKFVDTTKRGGRDFNRGKNLYKRDVKLNKSTCGFCSRYDTVFLFYARPKLNRLIFFIDAPLNNRFSIINFTL